MTKKNKADFDFEAAQKMSSADIRKFMDERECRFAEEYLDCYNATDAAIRAGYSPGKNNASAAVQGSRLKNDERVIAYRQALLHESVRDMDLTRDNIVKKLTVVLQRCMSAVPVMIWNSDSKEWENSGEWKFDANGAIKALAQLSKILGIEAPTVHKFEGKSFEDFIKSLGGGRTY